MRQQARRSKQFGPRAVLAKGGHLEGVGDEIVDVLVDDEGDTAIRGQRIEGVTPHGTGCALSSEIACRLAFGTPLREAVIGACNRVRMRIAEARAVGPRPAVPGVVGVAASRGSRSSSPRSEIITKCAITITTPNV